MPEYKILGRKGFGRDLNGAQAVMRNDWEFQLFGFPVRVELWFWIAAVFLGSNLSSLILIALWVGIVFLSVLVHELGHAFVGRSFGLAPEITLHAMGGITQSRVARRLSPLQNGFLSVAGPGAGFLFAGIVFLLHKFLPIEFFDGVPYWRQGFRLLLWVNLGWGIFNLFPILPLDGGQVLRFAVHALRGRPDEWLPRVVSIVAALFVAAGALFVKMYFLAFFVAWMAYSNFTELQNFRRSAVATSK